jgi:hypothetical protein
MRVYVFIRCGVISRSAKKKRSLKRTKKQAMPVLLQVKVSHRAADLLRRRATLSLRTQASYLRAIIYRDLGLFSG